MLSQKAQAVVSAASTIPKRCINSVVSPLEQKYFQHIGNREVVGYGRNGLPQYFDDVAFPYPSIRFRSHSDEVSHFIYILEIDALIKKESGDWTALSVDEKKVLYRHSFCRTLSEARAPSPRYKLGIAYAMVGLTLGASLFLYYKHFLLPDCTNKLARDDYKDAMRYIEVFSRRGPLDEVYKFDLENRRWRDK